METSWNSFWSQFVFEINIIVVQCVQHFVANVIHCNVVGLLVSIATVLYETDTQRSGQLVGRPLP